MTVSVEALGIGVVVVARGICGARVYRGAHNRLDATCGFAAGVAVGGILNLIVGVDPRSAQRLTPLNNAPVEPPAS